VPTIPRRQAISAANRSASSAVLSRQDPKDYTVQFWTDSLEGRLDTESLSTSDAGRPADVEDKLMSKFAAMLVVLFIITLALGIGYAAWVMAVVTGVV
jgi:hypothetical protein